MRTVIIFLVFGLCLKATAQKNTVYLEFLGNGIFSSLNYERQLTKEPGLSARLGVGYVPPTFDPGLVTIPVSFQYEFSLAPKHKLEVGLGGTVIPEFIDDPCGWLSFHCQIEEEKGTLFFYAASLSYKKLFGKQQNWMWKVGFNPYLGVSFNGQTEFSQVKPYFGLALGRRF